MLIHTLKKALMQGPDPSHATAVDLNERLLSG